MNRQPEQSAAYSTICRIDESPGLGRCCCNCRWQMVAVCHPWNKTFAKGRISEIFGWLCAMPDFSMPDANGEKAAVFFDGPHGMCEMHVFKENRAKSPFSDS